MAATTRPCESGAATLKRSLFGGSKLAFTNLLNSSPAPKRFFSQKKIEILKNFQISHYTTSVGT